MSDHRQPDYADVPGGFIAAAVAVIVLVSTLAGALAAWGSIQ